jgi:hypothetical protein
MKDIMNIDTFWQLIEEANEQSESDLEKQVSLLVEKLTELTVEEILDFDRIFNEMFVLSHSAELWSAAYLINGDCTEDSFDYFRGWLIAQGRDVFELALKDPEVFAEVVNNDIAGDIECEAMLYVAGTAYENKTQKDDFDFITMGNFNLENLQVDMVEEENHLNLVFQKVYKKFNT